MREYLMGVLCAAFLCSFVNSIGGEGHGMRRLISGIFLALALLHPLGSLDLPEISLDPFLEDAEKAAEDGQAQARTAQNVIITDALEAYILTKAAELDLTIEARVDLTSDGMPASVTLSGSASPSERQVLTDVLTAALGLGKEEIKWMPLCRDSE